ncbi:hypothetical protein ACFOW6_01095 [Fodinicurvata halophila]|uniref:Uncharacterized protein n=1 Tax=Fodinicurvata halophila TaxID=1419723 RepID=A0ABV8UGR3_9PROT
MVCSRSLQQKGVVVVVDPDIRLEVLNSLGLPTDRHLRYAAHPYFENCQRFCRDWDQEAFDPDYPTKPLSHFEPMLREIFARPPFDPDILKEQNS